MLTTLTKIKTELIRRYKLAQTSRGEKLTFNYFQKIADYVDWIKKHEGLKKIIDNETNSFQEYFLVKRGWNIDSAKQKLGDEEEGDFNHAYLNLFNVYLAVEDLDLTDKNEDDPDNYYLSHRIKSAKQLAKIRDSYKIVGYSYFCFHKNKYSNWLKTVHEKILAELAFTEIEESKNNNTQKQENI